MHPVQLTFEALEDRCVLSASGIPWSDAQHLSLSFAQDNSSINGVSSELIRVLDAQMPRVQWQTQILRAFQTWAAQSNINFGIVGDSGSAFGVTGPAQGDPRFGDVRIGGYRQTPEVLAINVPYTGILAGTWDGDVFLNTSYSFGSSSGQYDLTAVFLDEAGNVLGLADNNNPASALYRQYAGPRTSLNSNDVSLIQALYGVRQPDAWEGTYGNDTLARATYLSLSTSGSSDLDGDLTTLNDVDVYRFKTPYWTSGMAGVTVQLQAAGISLLTAKLSVLDASGNVVVSKTAIDPTNNNVTIYLPTVTSNSNYYVKVQSGSSDVFGIGKYHLQIGYGSPTAQNSAVSSTLYVKALDQIITTPINYWVGPGQGADDTLGTARQLQSDSNVINQTQYVVAGTIDGSTDKDYYRFTSANLDDDQQATMKVTIVGLGDASAPQVSLYDKYQQLVSPRVTVTNSQVVTLELSSFRTGKDYYLGVKTATGSGDYLITVSFSESHSNDTFSQADQLSTTPGYASKTHYEQSGGLDHAGDVDIYQIRSPSGLSASNAMTIEVRSQGATVVDSNIAVFDDRQNPVAAQILRHANGTCTVQVINAVADKNYYIKVFSTWLIGLGNTGDYSLVVDFGQQAVAQQTLSSGTVTSAASQQFFILQVKQNQLVHLGLTATTVTPTTSAALRLQVFSATGQILARLGTKAGDTRTGDFLLAAGNYLVGITGVTSDGSTLPAIGYTLRGIGLSDPIGPGLDDPTQNPITTTPPPPPPPINVTPIPLVPAVTIYPVAPPPPTTTTDPSTQYWTDLLTNSMWLSLQDPSSNFWYGF